MKGDGAFFVSIPSDYPTSRVIDTVPKVDSQSLHGSCPVFEGEEKWVAQVWVHNRLTSPWFDPALLGMFTMAEGEVAKRGQQKAEKRSMAVGLVPTMCIPVAEVVGNGASSIAGCEDGHCCAAVLLAVEAGSQHQECTRWAKKQGPGHERRGVCRKPYYGDRTNQQEQWRWFFPRLLQESDLGLTFFLRVATTSIASKGASTAAVQLVIFPLTSPHCHSRSGPGGGVLDGGLELASIRVEARRPTDGAASRNMGASLDALIRTLPSGMESERVVMAQEQGAREGTSEESEAIFVVALSLALLDPRPSSGHYPGDRARLFRYQQPWARSQLTEIDLVEATRGVAQQTPGRREDNSHSSRNSADHDVRGAISKAGGSCARLVATASVGNGLRLKGVGVFGREMPAAEAMSLVYFT
jgi:hypothetical protein